MELDFEGGKGLWGEETLPNGLLGSSPMKATPAASMQTPVRGFSSPMKEPTSQQSQTSYKCNMSAERVERSASGGLVVDKSGRADVDFGVFA